MKHTGVSWTFSPVACIVRDLRWCQVDISFGEDPYLIGILCSALIKGLQGDTISSDPNHVLATAKHYAGYSETRGSLDAAEADLSHRKLLTYFLPPFQKCVEAGCGAIMSAYQAIDGIPVTANEWLLKKVLRDDWKFDGIVITDYDNVGKLIMQKVCKDESEAAITAINGGNDIIMDTSFFYEACLKEIKSGNIDPKLIEESCRRILRMKFKLGLFENDRPYEPSKVIVNTPEHREVALRAAREGLILLENNGILPLDPNGSQYHKIAVIGPNANSPIAQLGDWSLRTHSPDLTITPLKGIQKIFKGEVITQQYRPDAIEQTIDVAKVSDLSIVVIGDNLEFVGERKATATLELQLKQKKLLKHLRKENIPFILVSIASKPLIIPEKALKASSAYIQQFNPGMLGGQALAEILFGIINPCGRLTVSVPYHVGQMPIYYNTVDYSHSARYADLTANPKYPFGYGLLYTQIVYKNLKINKNSFTIEETLEAKVTIENVGERVGVEVVQAYISVSNPSVTWPHIELKGFERVEVKPKEIKEVIIKIPIKECSIVNKDCKRLVEYGQYFIIVSPSSKLSSKTKMMSFNICPNE